MGVGVFTCLDGLDEVSLDGQPVVITGTSSRASARLNTRPRHTLGDMTPSERNSLKCCYDPLISHRIWPTYRLLLFGGVNSEAIPPTGSNTLTPDTAASLGPSSASRTVRR